MNDDFAKLITDAIAKLGNDLILAAQIRSGWTPGQIDHFQKYQRAASEAVKK